MPAPCPTTRGTVKNQKLTKKKPQNISTKSAFLKQRGNFVGRHFCPHIFILRDLAADRHAQADQSRKVFLRNK